MTDPDFPSWRECRFRRWGANLLFGKLTPKLGLPTSFLAKLFLKNCMKMKEIGTGRNMCLINLLVKVGSCARKRGCAAKREGALFTFTAYWIIDRTRLVPRRCSHRFFLTFSVIVTTGQERTLTDDRPLTTHTTHVTRTHDTRQVRAQQIVPRRPPRPPTVTERTQLPLIRTAGPCLPATPTPTRTIQGITTAPDNHRQGTFVLIYIHLGFLVFTSPRVKLIFNEIQSLKNIRLTVTLLNGQLHSNVRKYKYDIVIVERLLC